VFDETSRGQDDGPPRVDVLLLTIARRLGEPAAVFVGEGFEAAQPGPARYGATKVYRAGGEDLTAYLVVPQAELLAQLVEQATPAAVLIAACRVHGGRAGEDRLGRHDAAVSGLHLDGIRDRAGPGLDRQPRRDLLAFRLLPA
jgi:electron transfer flavoprotein alpha subunit